MSKYSLVVPLYNEELVIRESYNKLKSVMDSLNEEYEIVFVNDGSKDDTREIICEICKSNSNIKLINFSRNFGHQVAITAGMDYANADAVIVIDADLQDPPEIIPKMIEQWKLGYDIVYGRRTMRKGETVFKKLTAKIFYLVLKSMTSVDIPVDTGDFRLIDRKVCDAMKGISEQNRYIRGLVAWLGFKQTAVEYVRNERFAGETKYPLKKMIKLATDGITSFSYKPLKLGFYIGLLILFSSIFWIAVECFSFRVWKEPIYFLIAVVILCNSVIILLVGMVSEYISRIYDEVRKRPLYIIKDIVSYEK